MRNQDFHGRFQPNVCCDEEPGALMKHLQPIACWDEEPRLLCIMIQTLYSIARHDEKLWIAMLLNHYAL